MTAPVSRRGMDRTVAELDDALSLVLDQMRSSFSARLREIDLTPPSAVTLRLLSAGPLPLGAIAEHFNIDASAVTWIADRLESRGLAVRNPSSSDRRVKLLTITDAGRDLVGVMHSCSDDFPGIARLSRAERKQLADLLRRAFA